MKGLRLGFLRAMYLRIGNQQDRFYGSMGNVCSLKPQYRAEIYGFLTLQRVRARALSCM
jgi:hypothetical protein